MENFLLTRKDRINQSKIVSSFDKYFPESEGIFRNIGNHIICLFKKGPRFPSNFFELNNWFVGTIGTPIYKGLSYNEGLKEILRDEIKGTFKPDNLLGHFYIFIGDGTNVKILTDGSGLLKVYYDSGSQCLCSSFLVMTEVVSGNLTINKDALTENLLTGGIIGGETILNEIREFSPRCNFLMEGVRILSPGFQPIEEFRNIKDAFERQIETLDGYFLSAKNLADDFDVDSGLTGGLDSRLILALVRKHFNSYQVHSHFRSERHPDLEVASEISKDLKIPFVSPKVIDWQNKSEIEKQITFNDSLRFCDGQARQHCYWKEEYNTVLYKQNVLKGKGLGLQGIGGEQYRNVERMFQRGVNFERWLYYHHIGMFSGLQNLRNPVCKEVVSRIKQKISKELNFPIEKERISLLDLKRIYNEILIASFRGIRTNSENRFSFSLSPFADYRVSHTAYSIVPFLDCTYNFEIDLVKHFGPDLAEFKSTYGYSFIHNEPYSKFLVPTVIQNFVPYRISMRILEEYKSRNHKSNISEDTKNEGFLKSCINNIHDLNIPLNIEMLLSRIDTSNMLYSIGFIVGELKHKLK